MHEQAFRFGRADHLVGIAGLAAAVPPAADRIGVIVLNAGLVHRIGPFRLHVDLTRRLNALGHPTLRFDLSTLGDSGATSESQSRQQQVRADVADAMTLLGQQAGCHRFVLVGLCSGAQDAHTVACADPRVAGAIFLDGYMFRTMGFHLRHYLPRLLDPAKWRRFLMQRRRAPAPAPQGAVFSVAYPPLRQVRSELSGLLDRGLRLCFVYSGGITRVLNHPRQFRECFGRQAMRPGIEAHFLDGTDHTFILACDRQRLLATIEEWMRRNFPIPTSTSP
jgi:pimeloyl-ACP methyl ester carboxylesterase